MPTCPAARRLSAAAACVLALLAVLVVAPVVRALSAQDADRVITITADGVPGTTTIAPGDTVTFVNGDPATGRRYTPRSSSGNWTFSTDEQPIDLSPGLGSGESYTVPDPLTAEGTYTFTVSRADPALEDPVIEGAVVVRRPAVPSPAPASGAPAFGDPASSAPASAPGRGAPGSGAPGGGGPGGSAPGGRSPDSGAPAAPRPGPARSSAPSSSPTGGTGAVAAPPLGGIDGGAAPLGPAPGQAPAIALPGPEGLPALPGSAGAPAPQTAGEPTPTAVVAAAVRGDLPGAGNRRAYGLPAALAAVLAAGVVSLLVRLLLAEPAARRVVDALTGRDPVVTVD